MSGIHHGEEKVNASKPERTAERGADPSNDAWLARPSSIRLLWWVFAAVLLLSVAAQLGFKVKGTFGIDGWMGFGAAFGFLSCVAMVLFAKVLGAVLKRKEDYFGARDDD